MFLDDELYQKVKSKELYSPEDFKELVNDLYDICENYFKPKLEITMTYTEGTALMDRVFKLWDLFIIKLEKEEWFLIDVLKKYSYKNAFLADEKLNEIYKKGK